MIEISEASRLDFSLHDIVVQALTAVDPDHLFGQPDFEVSEPWKLSSYRSSDIFQPWKHRQASFMHENRVTVRSPP